MAKTERSGHTTTDHDFIRQWVEERGGWPARVKGTGKKNDAGLIRIDFPGFSGEGSLERIEWDEWLEAFDANGLAFLHRDLDHGGGDLDRFNKLVTRTGDEGGEGSGGGRGGGRARSAVASSARKTASSGGGAARKTASGGTARKSASGGAARKSASSTAETRSRSKSEGASESRSRTKPSGAGETRSRSRASAEEGTNDLRALLLHELGDLLSAERIFLVSTRALAREALDPTVKARAEEHVTETEGQIERIREAFAAIGERPKAVKCEAAQGLKEEHDSFKSEDKPTKPVLSAFGLGSGLRVEHYEIAAYRSAIALANALGEKECANILKENLKEEESMASFLEKAGRTVLKGMAAAEA
ncbi:MAG TPA: ferritin-like domain-containing protein [Longimicrobium sp.]|nr:ferritin-like domain-containing protein [Longimicrobium sp.]